MKTKLNKNSVLLIFTLIISTGLPLTTNATEIAKTKWEELKDSGIAKMDANNESAAIEDFSKAIALNPNDSNLFLFRGLSKNSLKKYKEALKDVTKAIELDSTNGEAHYVSGIIKRDLKDHKGAIADFTKAMEVSPANYQLLVRAYSGRAGAKNDLGDYVGSIKDYDAVTKLDSKKAVTYFLRAIIKLKMGNKNGALTDLSKGAELGHSGSYDALSKLKEME